MKLGEFKKIVEGLSDDTDIILQIDHRVFTVPLVHKVEKAEIVSKSEIPSEALDWLVNIDSATDKLLSIHATSYACETVMEDYGC